MLNMAKISACALVIALWSQYCVSYAFLEFLFGSGHSKSNPDVLCIMEHCGKESEACARDHNCRNNMICMTKCGLTNHSCMYQCMNTYDDKVFDDMMKCLVDDNHCMALEPPDPSFRYIVFVTTFQFFFFFFSFLLCET